MKTRKLTEAAIMSALFVVSSIFAITTGLLYSFYLDMIVPIFIAIIYFRCDMKYTLLAIITCLAIIGLIIGDIGSAIWMSQSMLIGVMCGFIIPKKTKILDDILYLSIFACFIIVMVDVYCSQLIGFSFMKDFRETMNAFTIPGAVDDIVFYFLIATIPLGTVLVAYLGSLVIGDRLKCLNENAKEKFYMVKNIRKYVSYIYCSKTVICIGLAYIAIIQIKDLMNVNINQVYILTITETIKYIIYYFILRDAFSYIRIYIYHRTRSLVAVNLVGIVFLVLLILNFSINFWIICASAFIYIPIRIRKIA